jgi:hypothetical protein
MTKHFAVMNDLDYVENVILCETKELAEELTGQTCIEYTPDGICGIGSKWTGTEFLVSDNGNPDNALASSPDTP